MTPKDRRPSRESFAPVAVSDDAAEADVVQELRSLGASLPREEALILPRKRVWARLAGEVAAGRDRARGAA